MEVSSNRNAYHWMNAPCQMALQHRQARIQGFLQMTTTSVQAQTSTVLRKCDWNLPTAKLHPFLAFAIIALLLAHHSNAQSKPNIILINLDDADSEMFEIGSADQLYPNIMGLAKSGITFTNLHVTTPFCGPSRASLYRGQYAHNTGICVNEPGIESSHNFNGGFKFYREQGYFADDLSTWMQDAGYRTMLVGKFLHHNFEKIVPPGWDDFYSYLGARYYGSWRFTNQFSPEGSMDQVPPGIYRTDAEAQDVVQLLRAHAARNNQQPFFLNVNPIGPHLPDPRYPQMVKTEKQDWWKDIVQPFSPAYNNSDMGGFFRDLPKIPEWGHFYTNFHYRERALSVSSCDDMVGVIRKTLANLGLEQNTYIFLTSDNGFSLGHHRMFGKGVATDRCTRVPLLVMGPGIPEGRTANHLLAHIDLAPTFVALAKGVPPNFVDGRSFANLLTPTGIDTYPAFKQALLVENWSTQWAFGSQSHCASTTLRTINSVYTEWANGDKDFYDLNSDPQQINNSYDTLAPIYKDFLAMWLRIYKNPNQPSKARFSIPHLRNQTITANSGLRGLAEDPYGVASVQLAICDLSTNRYWDGSSWNDSFVRVEAELENPNGQITFWNYSSMPKGRNLVSGQLTAWAWAFDKNFRETPPSQAWFGYDQTAPEATLNSPSKDQRFTGPAFFQGTANDDIEVAEVRIFVRDQKAKRGRSFARSRLSIVKPDSQGDWGLMLSLPRGKYEVLVTAIDTSGNSNGLELVQPFSVD